MITDFSLVTSDKYNNVTTDLINDLLGPPVEKKLEQSPIIISQSLLKDLDKEAVCPHRLYLSYILGHRIDADENTPMHKGVCFEYFFNGSVGVGGKAPYIPQKKGGDIPVDYQRLKEQAHFLRYEVFPYYGFEEYEQDVELTTEFVHPELPIPVKVRGRLDLILFKDYKPVIGDLKATGEIDNSYSLNAWKSPSTMDHKQAYLYMWLFIRNQEFNRDQYIPDFYYFVFEWGPKKDYEIIKVEWNSMHFREVERIIIDGYKKMIEYQDQNWPKVPSFYECKDCPIKHACEQRKTIKDIKIVR